MDKRDLLLTALKSYKTDFESEKAFIQEMIDFIEVREIIMILLITI